MMLRKRVSCVRLYGYILRVAKGKNVPLIILLRVAARGEGEFLAGSGGGGRSGVFVVYVGWVEAFVVFEILCILP